MRPCITDLKLGCDGVCRTSPGVSSPDWQDTLLQPTEDALRALVGSSLIDGHPLVFVWGAIAEGNLDVVE